MMEDKEKDVENEKRRRDGEKTENRLQDEADI